MEDQEKKKLYWHTDTLIPWKDNPRSASDEDLSRLEAQYEELGEYKPIIINSGKHWGQQGLIAGGNTRYKIYKKKGLQQVWVSVINPKSEMEFVKYALSDNDQVGHYIEEELKSLVTKLDTDNELEELSNYHVSEGESYSVNSLLGEEKDEKDDEKQEFEPDKTPARAELGKVYTLGRHRVMCGDALNAEHLVTLLNGVRADVVFTDPPYNVGYDYQSYDDNKTPEEYKQFCTDWFTLLRAHSDFICITPGTVNTAMWATIEPWKSIGIWYKKNTLNSGEVSYLRVWEPLLFYGKPKQRRNTDMFEYPLIIVKDMEHTCPKPIDLIADILQSFGAVNTLDIFGGSGSTLIAAEKVSIPSYNMEIDPKYVDVMIRRYCKMIGADSEEIYQTAL